MSRRPYLKLRLTDNKDSWKAQSIVLSWLRLKQMSQYVPKAILMYDALLKGDTSLLMKNFPFIGLQGIVSTPARPVKPIGTPKIERTEVTTEQILQNFEDSIGLSLNFGSEENE